MVTRTKTIEECEVACLLMGENWTYGQVSHTFISRENQGTDTWLCAETLQPLTHEELRDRRAYTHNEQREIIDAWINKNRMDGDAQL